MVSFLGRLGVLTPIWLVLVLGLVGVDAWPNIPANNGGLTIVGRSDESSDFMTISDAFFHVPPASSSEGFQFVALVAISEALTARTLTVDVNGSPAFSIQPAQALHSGSTLSVPSGIRWTWEQQLGTNQSDAKGRNLFLLRAYFKSDLTILPRLSIRGSTAERQFQSSVQIGPDPGVPNNTGAILVTPNYKPTFTIWGFRLHTSLNSFLHVQQHIGFNFRIPNGRDAVHYRKIVWLTEDGKETLIGWVGSNQNQKSGQVQVIDGEGRDDIVNVRVASPRVLFDANDRLNLTLMLQMGAQVLGQSMDIRPGGGCPELLQLAARQRQR